MPNHSDFSIHRLSLILSAQLVVRHGCDGVWLIDHYSVNGKTLVECFNAARAKFPKLWMGVNLLQFLRRPLDVFQFVAQNMPSCSGVWSDASFVEPTAQWHPGEVARIGLSLQSFLFCYLAPFVPRLQGHVLSGVSFVF